MPRRTAPDYSTAPHSEARRLELGHDQVFVRPPAPANATVNKLAAKLGTTRSGAVAYAIHKVWQELEGASETKIREAIRVVHQLHDRVGR